MPAQWVRLEVAVFNFTTLDKQVNGMVFCLDSYARLASKVDANQSLVSIPYFDENWRPTSFYPKIQYNRNGGMHTLCLLDIKVKEPDFEAMKRGKTVYLPPRFMSVNESSEQLIEAEEVRGRGAYDPDRTLCVGLARLGQSDQCIIAGTLNELRQQDFGSPLHCMIICGEVHDMELEALRPYLLKDSRYEIDAEGTLFQREVA